jgi:hypothetical protein
MSLVLLAYACLISTVHAQGRKAPAYPLITHNTYFSIWSNTDQLNKSTPTHWTGAEVQARYCWLNKNLILF